MKFLLWQSAGVFPFLYTSSFPHSLLLQMWFETNLFFLCCELSWAPEAGRDRVTEAGRRRWCLSSWDPRRMLALPAKGDSPGTLGDFDSSAETTHGSQASSVSIPPRNKDAMELLWLCVRAFYPWKIEALVLCSPHPAVLCHPAQWGRAEPRVGCLGSGWAVPMAPVLLPVPQDGQPEGRHSRSILWPLGRAHQQLLMCTVAWQSPDGSAWLPMGF